MARMKMMKRTFALNDGSRQELFVVDQKSKRYDAISVRISKVLDLDNVRIRDEEAIVGYRYIYEEINQDGMATYARFMDIRTIKEYYEWAM